MNEIDSGLKSSTTNNESREGLINELVKMQIDLSKKCEELTTLKYELNYVNIELIDKNDNGKTNEKNPPKKSKCIQSVVKFENRFVVAEKPVVLKYKFKKTETS